MDPRYRADIVIVPPLRAILLISYWGRPKTISESVKRILPRMFYHLGILGLPPLLIKSPVTMIARAPIAKKRCLTIAHQCGA